ncbi:aldehyde dehydrogenase family 16 member A1 [Synchiropus splendidus]|uniref:aldehyde dehydrogenase family 16 member A1 n=1 Tax=Synchiropus splendidus TaxID=270530 RepID=UPI00237DDA26|nr:aldehyde dehydrogenase family 16 member A1 [Synchiropus splendidus]
MAGNPTTTVHDIFQNMEYGPAATPSFASAQAWLDHHSRALGFFVAGKFVLRDGKSTRVLLDSKGAEVCSSMCATSDDIIQCVSSSAAGSKAWAALSCHQRAKVLLRMAGVLGQHGQCVSELSELSGASCSAGALVRLCQFYGSWAQLRDALITNWTPLGVVLVAVSDDCGLYSLMLKVLPALAMGNSVIIVPGLSTAPSSLLLAQLFLGAGLPVGAINVLTGSDITLAVQVAENPGVSYVTYCGNKQDGVELCQATAGSGVPVTLTPNIGATCPIIIFESADLHSAVDAVVEAAFKKKKEVHWVLCVQESVSSSFVERLRLRMAGLKCVPLSGDAQRLQVDAAVQQAQQQGATLVQSCAAPSSGALYPPTVLCGAAPSSPCVVTPATGPLLPLMTFRSSAEAVTLGNHSPHGQAASIWTEDLTLALETAKNLSVGSVWVNSHSVSDPCFPVMGHKESGTCTDGGQEGLFQYLRPSSSSPHRSSPSALDYTKFGTEPSAVGVPDVTTSAPKSYLQFVGGKACKSVSGCSVPVPAPGGGSGTLAYCPDGGQKDVRNAVEAATKVQPGWMKKSPSARAQSLLSLAKGLEANRTAVASAVRAQTGLSAEHADLEVELSVARLSDWAAYCDKIQGSSLPVPQSGCGLSIPEALGVIGAVLPDQNPLLAMVTVLGAAVATGNAVVMVPSESCPLPVLAFVQVLQSADLPAGLVNVVTGRRDALTRALANHSVIRGVWYWGTAEGCQFLQHSCPLKTLLLCCHGDQDWQDPSVLQHMWRNGVQWKSVWIPTA